MFKLIKLAVYVLIGYALYEMYQGFKESEAEGEEERISSGGRAGQQTFSGRGQGTTMRTDEPSGMSATHNVGRGVIAQ
jgi:hypothetical protein